MVSKPESAGIAIYDGLDGLRFWAVQSDISGRLWLGNDLGIYLWTPAVGLQKVYTYSGATMAEAHEVLPSGRCT